MSVMRSNSHIQTRFVCSFVVSQVISFADTEIVNDYDCLLLLVEWTTPSY